MAGKVSPLVNDNTDKNCDGDMNDVGKLMLLGNQYLEVRIIEVVWMRRVGMLGNCWNSSGRRYDGDSFKARPGFKNGMVAKTVNSGKGNMVNKVSGSRFEILSEVADVMNTDVEVQAKPRAVAVSITKGKLSYLRLLT
ncbi:hypothetical protein LWI29_003913 [Acer saccharum]|uniref:Uncharacterized protein n=1 Tax=Acer saccharum TaxID=4024 RepID=A0AA39W5H5_ACESA|nr:hypothetical protein LWI29_003913 [Acer saccharum]